MIKKAIISIMLAVALIITSFSIMPIVNADGSGGGAAGGPVKKCSHKWKQQSIIPLCSQAAGSSYSCPSHKVIYKCKKCGKKKSEIKKCSFTKNKKYFRLPDGSKHYMVKYCVCGTRKQYAPEKHTYKNGKCIKCGYKK